MFGRRLDIGLQVKVPDRDPGRLPVRFTYQSARPLEVTFTFTSLHGRPSWVIGRDLLRAGLLDLAGEGDVILFPYGDDEVSLTMAPASHPEEGSLTIIIPALPLGQFLASTADLVPYGAEGERLDLDMDVELRKLLGS